MVSAQLRMWLLAAMLLLASIVDAAGTPQGRATCTNPSKRKEWRQLTRDEKADWVRAVKVNHCVYVERTSNESYNKY